MGSKPKLKIVILGSAQSGKSAIAVRFLTHRYISEYSSQADLLYSRTLHFDQRLLVEMDILDTCSLSAPYQLEHIAWANACVVVYSINEEESFLYASKLLEAISVIKSTEQHSCHTLLLANKVDLSEFGRQVSVVRGQELSQRFSCAFSEVSAAEDFREINGAFQKLIHMSRPTLEQQCFRFLQENTTRTSPSLKVSKIFGQMLAKISNKRQKATSKKKKSLSI